MNWLRVLGFSLGLFVATNIVTAAIAYTFIKLGYETPGNFILVISITAASFSISFLAYSLLAVMQISKPYTHALCVLGLDWFFNILATFIIARKIFLIPGLWFELPLSVLVLILGVSLGIKIRNVPNIKK